MKQHRAGFLLYKLFKSDQRIEKPIGVSQINKGIYQHSRIDLVTFVLSYLIQLFIESLYCI